MIKMKGNKITFTGKDAKELKENAKKFKMTPRQYVLTAIETHARNVLFRQALDQTDPKTRVGGVVLSTERVKLRKEGTD